MILWLRNDLRIDDNPAVQFALQHQVKEAVFLATPTQWRAHNLSGIKVDLILRQLDSLQIQLAELGINLKLINVEDFAGQIKYLCQYHHSDHIVANREVELNEGLRDEALINQGLNLTLFECDVIVPKGKVVNQQGEMYKVFTPFKKAWLSYAKNNGFSYFSALELSSFSSPLWVEKIAETSCANKNLIVQIKADYPTTDSSRWPLADLVLKQVLPKFIDDKLAAYDNDRDFPALKATSGLSPYLAIGAISPKYLLTLLINKHPDILVATDLPSFTWLNELIWREFYRHLLFSFPALAKGNNFNAKYDYLPWRNSLDDFTAWKEGRTGYPIVDAAMRQLKQTGWMHNRLRMIVASFLTKHLLIDWRWGEKYFSEQLIDGDLAANNGGWQWAAGTGCDAQPYFRIFNPITQSQKFDPDGSFIRKYLPELTKVPLKYIHFPHSYLANNDESNTYWPPIVEHKNARLKALDFYKSHLS